MFKEWIYSVMSIRENRISTIVLILFIFTGFGLWQFIQTGDIVENVKGIITTCLLLVGGINVSDAVLGIAFKNQNKDNKTEIETGGI